MQIDSRRADELKQSWDTITQCADCIVVPGSFCDETTGVPTKDLKVRCDYELLAKKQIKNYKLTIVSGGQGRGVEKYLARDPSATEAGQMKQYAVNQGEPAKDYLEEPMALDTLGNVVFSTKLLLENGCKHPVFITQQYHGYQFDPMLDHWFGKSGIQSHLWPVADAVDDAEGQKKRREKLDDETIRTLLSRNSDEVAGHAFVYRGFIPGTIGLPFKGWPSKDVKWTFEVAIRWLFKFHKGHLTYRDVYNDVDTLLKKFLA